MLRTNEQNLKLIKEYPNIRDGIILLKIWLGQRELNKGFDAFSGHVITMYVLYLLRTKKLNTFMSSYQIVRNVWNSLGMFIYSFPFYIPRSDFYPFIAIPNFLLFNFFQLKVIGAKTEYRSVKKQRV